MTLEEYLALYPSICWSQFHDMLKPDQHEIDCLNTILTLFQVNGIDFTYKESPFVVGVDATISPDLSISICCSDSITCRNFTNVLCEVMYIDKNEPQILLPEGVSEFGIKRYQTAQELVNDILSLRS